MTEAMADAAQTDRLKRLIPCDGLSDVFLEGMRADEWTWEPDRASDSRIEERRGLCKRRLGDGRMQMSCEDSWGDESNPSDAMEAACLSPKRCDDAWETAVRRHPLVTACRVACRRIVRHTAGLNYRLEPYAAVTRRTEVTVECGCGNERYRISQLIEDASQLGVMFEEAASVVEERMDAVTPASGEWAVVLAPGRTGIFTHEVFGHAAEAGEDDPRIQTHPQLRVVDGCDGPTVDDEGIIHREQVIFENGRFAARLTDLMNGLKTNGALTGNGRRQDYRSIPIPRLWRTYVDNGQHPIRMEGIRRGVYVHRLEGGHTRAGREPLGLRIADAQLIECGERTRRIRHGFIYGTPESLASAITEIGDDLSISRDVTYCGKQGQWVPVSVGGPSLLLKSVRVKF